jgi:FdhE protein
MTLNLALTSEQVKDAVEAVKKSKPVYADILDFYGRIFELQESSKRLIQIETLQIPQEACAVKAREKFPLIEIKDFVFDEIETGKLIIAICNLAKEFNRELAADAKIILKSFGTVIKPGELFDSLLRGEDRLYEKIADEIKIEATTLGFLSYNSLKPSLSVCADQLSYYLNKKDPWLKGYCPICGSLPILSILEGDGDRSLICSFCWHPWSVKRVFCPFCENLDSKTQHYFYSEEESELRGDLCDGCKKYLKTFDTRKAERMIYPPLEQIASLHLDYKAKELGYESGLRMTMQV